MAQTKKNNSKKKKINTTKKTVKKTNIKKKTTTKKKAEKRGFTLIELLAVIVILGLLIAIALPAVTRYITQSRKKTLLKTIDNFIQSAMTAANDNEYESLSDSGKIFYIPVHNESEKSCVSLEKGGLDPFGNFVEAYVVIAYNSEEYKYEFYFTFYDDAGYGMELTKSDEIKQSFITNPTTMNSETIVEQTIDGREINILQPGTCKSSDTIVVEAAPAPIIEKIYWALQDNDSNGSNETLVFSKNFVDGNYKGNFAGTKVFNNYSAVPWRVGAYNTSSCLSDDVTKVIVKDRIVPKSINMWFSGVGYNAPTFYADLRNINVSNVTDLSGAFSNTGFNASSVEINLSGWNTSNVTNMGSVFYNTGQQSNSVKIIGLNRWNTSKVTTMNTMFTNSGFNATTWNVGDLSRWDTSKVTSMSNMFLCVGMRDTSWNIGNLKNWNTSKVTTMNGMFQYAGAAATTFKLDLSNWNTSKVTNMNYMFSGAGNNATTWEIKIPKTNGNGINNTTTAMYGSTTSVVAVPNAGRSFTIAN